MLKIVRVGIIEDGMVRWGVRELGYVTNLVSCTD